MGSGTEDGSADAPDGYLHGGTTSSRLAPASCPGVWQDGPYLLRFRPRHRPASRHHRPRPQVGGLRADLLGGSPPPVRHLDRTVPSCLGTGTACRQERISRPYAHAQNEVGRYDAGDA
ncbi:hypothetical protein EVA_18639 [gut metagenome]|uniref:Uncharacterized protein n=1 Tax=gut metagenome TaxID=749906 RepID=J9G102_9ZZZZ